MPLQLLASMSTRGKATLAASALAFVVAAVVLLRLASAPTYATVWPGMDPADAGKVTAALDGAGVTYEIRSGGTEVAVVKGTESKARIALADQGVSGTARQPGFELLDKQKLGASNFQQQVAYQRALEGQIAQTVSPIDGRQRRAGAAHAAEGRALRRRAQARHGGRAPRRRRRRHGPGADPRDRQPGRLLGPGPQGRQRHDHRRRRADGVAARRRDGRTAPSSPAAWRSRPPRRATPRSSNRRWTHCSSAPSGPNKAQVQVARRPRRQPGDPGEAPVREEGRAAEGDGRERDAARMPAAAAGGAAGTTANLPGYARRAAAAGRHLELQAQHHPAGPRRRQDRDAHADRPRHRQRLDVAVVVDKKVPAADVAQLKTALTSAAGIRAARGDTLAVSQVAFAASPHRRPSRPGAAHPAGLAGP